MLLWQKMKNKRYTERDNPFLCLHYIHKKSVELSHKKKGCKNLWGYLQRKDMSNQSLLGVMEMI